MKSINWVLAENNEYIRIESIIGVGQVKPVKISSGKGQSLVERTVYNFTIRLGTGGVVIKSRDYESPVDAEQWAYNIINGGVAEEK